MRFIKYLNGNDLFPCRAHVRSGICRFDTETDLVFKASVVLMRYADIVGGKTINS